MISMEEKYKEQKRKISVGFKKPKSLESNIIYIWLEKPGMVGFGGVKATAVSNEEFNYKVRAIAGNIFHDKTKEATNHGCGIELNYYNCLKFIDEIAEKNNGDVDYSEAIQQGTNLFRAIREQIR